MGRLMQDGTAESVKQDSVLRRGWKQGKTFFLCLADHEQEFWQPYRSVDAHTELDCHTNIHWDFYHVERAEVPLVDLQFQSGATQKAKPRSYE